MFVLLAKQNLGEKESPYDYENQTFNIFGVGVYH